MTDTVATRPHTVARAALQAEALAAASDVSVRVLHDPAEMEAASALLAKIWKFEGSKTQIEPGLLVALAHAHNYVAGAYRGTELLAVCVGFFHPPPARTLHSHIAGVVGGRDGSGVGTALKHHQRAWCLRHGTDTMSWTFDPLVARNAYFNIHRLGAKAEQYLPNFYGRMTDSVNSGQDSDRMLLVWDLLREPPVHIPTSDPELAPEPEPEPEPEACVLHNDNGTPRLSLASIGDALRVRVEIPTDIESLRMEQPGQAALWRPALRDALTTLMSDGWRVTDFARLGYYSLERTPSRAHPQR